MNKDQLQKAIAFFDKVNHNKKIQEILLALSFLMLSAYIGISYKHIINDNNFWAYKVIMILASLTILVLIIEIGFMGKNRKVKDIRKVNRRMVLFTNFYRILMSLSNILIIITSGQIITIFEIIIIIISILMLLYSILRYTIFFGVYFYNRNKSKS